ncbi:MAG: NAD(P)-binding protein [Bacteroidales bacterium]|nr:NAD(P)-binding protein [Bacteroidales bacterium]
MIRTRIAIIGAGPAGLTLANALLQRGVSDFVVLEKETDVGGLCRSRDVDGSPLDIGGGHFLDVRRPNVTEFLFGFMPETEWDRYERDSRISIHGQMIGSPFEANIWQLDKTHQDRYLADIAAAGCNSGAPMPKAFVDWIYWKLGKGIAEDYMLPYNRKMFGDDLNQLGTYWLEKLPNVSYEDTLRSCEEHRPYAQQPGHATFYYPKKFGYGEVWRRMGEAIGDRLLLDTPARSLDVGNRFINSDIEADAIVNTSPWTSFEDIIGASVEAKKVIASLKHTSVDIEYVSENLDTQAQWIYLPDPALPEHRLLVRHNFCPGSRGYWKETRHERSPELTPGMKRFTMDYAYPLNTIGKNELMQSLLNELAMNKIYGLGRWGEWQHYNSDLVVDLSLKFANRLQGKRA